MGPVVAMLGITAAGLGAVDVSASTAPDSGAADCEVGTTGRIAFMLKQQTAFRYLNADIPFFTETAEAAGYEVLVQSAENDAATQVSQAENVLTQGVDAIVIQPVDFNVAGSIADMAREAGVPLASYDDLILNSAHAAFIGRDPKEGGAEAAREAVAAAPTGNYVLIGGDPGQTGSTLMQEGYHEVLDPLVEAGDITIVMDQFTPGWKTEPAQAFAENALTANDNDVQVFLSSYDGMTLGILQAISQAGIPDGQILVTGQDMELSAMQAIAEGRQFGSLWPAPEEMAVAGAETAIALANCEPIVAELSVDNGAGEIPFIKTPIYLVTQPELADFACTHQYWQDVDEVYANVPDERPDCEAAADGSGSTEP
jgi:D-xylose transport system substrate-binding protein